MVSQPPTTGPNAAATPAVAPHAAKAVARSRPLNVPERMASVVGIINDAPIPSMTASPTINWPTDVENEASSDPTPNSASADDEDLPVPVCVAQPAADDEQGGEGQRIPRDDPFKAGQGGVELAQDRRDRHVEHGVVEHHDEGGHDGDGQRDPAGRIELLGDCAGLHVRLPGEMSSLAPRSMYASRAEKCGQTTRIARRPRARSASVTSRAENHYGRFAGATLASVPRPHGTPDVCSLRCAT